MKNFLIACCLLTGSAAPLSAAGPSVTAVHAFNSGLNCNGIYRVLDTGSTNSWISGDDGFYQPAALKPSYTILNLVGTSSVTVDNVTGLMWVTNMVDAGVPAASSFTWVGAISLCENLNYAGYDDWRLPNVKELMSIVGYNKSVCPIIDSNYFLNTQYLYYWSSTTYAPTTTSAWYVYFGCNSSNSTLYPTGGTYSFAKSTYYFARCVRAGPY